ncbi:MAG: AAA family ATPase [Acetobacterium woodii]|nr:AAA family ATPase [Acetobacterium woodii]
MYQSLLSKINIARGRSSKFFKVDLHVHSHESDDFPRAGHKSGSSSNITERDKSATTKDFIDAGNKAGLKLMAITDHNKSKIAEEIASLSDQNLAILPGMEVSVKTSFLPESTVHILSIFPEKFGNADIERVFGKGGMALYSERKDDAVLNIPIDEFIKSVHSNRGICIASHVNSNKGIRTLFRESSAKLIRTKLRKLEFERRENKNDISPQEKLELESLVSEWKELEDELQNQYLLFLTEFEFDAVEVQKSNDKQFYSGTHVDDLGIRPIPCVIGSDAHNLSDIGLKGNCTYIKMTRPGFDDLKKALLDPGTRIRFEDDVPSPPIARILGIQFDGGFFQQHTISFSDNLTCLIGGRGSGKSATLEALRYVLGHPTNHLFKDKQQDIQDRLKYTLQDADIKIAFVDHNGDTYILKRRYGESRTGCYEIDGTARAEIDVAVASNLQAKIFGWGEIEELARNKREQLLLIDGFVPELKVTKERIEDLHRTIRENTNKITTLAEEIKSLLPRVAELPTKKALLSKLNSDALNAVFSDYDKNQQAQGAIEGLRNTVIENRKPFLQSDLEPFQLKEVLEEALKDILTKINNYSWENQLKVQFGSSANQLQEQYQSLLNVWEQLIEILNEIKNKLEIEGVDIDNNLNKAAEEAETSDAKSMLSKRKTLTEEVNALQAIQDQIDQKQQNLQTLLQDRWGRIVPELQQARRNATKIRRGKLSVINSQLRSLTATAKVNVTLLHQKERKAFMLTLGTGIKGDPEGLLKKVNRHYIADKYAEHYSKRHSPHTFVQAILDEADEAGKNLQISSEENDNVTKVISQENALDVRKHLHPKIDGGPYLEPEKLRKLLEIEHCDTEDLVQISLDERLIEELSPGQRCSALIPIILLEGDCPLIIDQPEDNLDNKLVFSLVVDIVRGLKEKRQIIVATHNPNIPVSGDAEQIVVFETLTRERCEKIILGSIDCEDVVDQVKGIMEGSEEAFRIRAEKYGYKMRAKPEQKS